MEIKHEGYSTLTEKGVVQGMISSPMMFNIYMM